jgi:translation initiation factor 1A
MPPKKKKIVNRADRGGGELVFKDDDQRYASVIRPLGDRRFQVVVDDGREAIAKLRGNFRRREVVMAGTVVLVAERFGDTGKFDVLLRYGDVHTKLLTKYGELDDLKKAKLDWQRAEDERLYGKTDSVNVDDDLVDFADDVDVDLV